MAKFTLKSIPNYTGSIKSSSGSKGLANFVKQAKLSLNTSNATKVMNDYVKSLPVSSMKIVSNIQASDSVKKIMEDAQKGIAEIQNTFKTSALQQAMLNIQYDTEKTLNNLNTITKNELKSVASEDLHKQILNDAITGINTIKTNALGLVNEVIVAPKLETTKIVNVAMSKLQTQLLKDQGYTGTVLLSKMTLPEGQMYFKIEDLRTKPELLKTLLASGKITQEQLQSGGVPTKQMMPEYMDYMATHTGEKNIYPVLPEKTTIKQGNIAPKGTYSAPSYGITQAIEEKKKGTFSGPGFGITPETFNGIVSKDQGKFVVQAGIKEGEGSKATVKTENIYFTDKNKAIEYAKDFFNKNQDKATVGVSEVGKETLVIFGASAFGAGAPTTAAKITYDMGNGGKLTTYTAKESPLYAATLKDAQFKGAKIENANLTPIASIGKSTLSSEGTKLVNKLLGLTGAKITVNEDIKVNLLEISKDTTPLSTNIEKTQVSQNPTAGKWFWETWEVEGTPKQVSQLGNWIQDRLMTEEYSAERAGLISIGPKAALNIGDILTLNDKSGKANVFAPILNIIDWTQSSSIKVTDKGRQLNDLMANNLKEGKSVGELVPGISENTAKYTFLTTAEPFQLGQVTQSKDGLHQINLMAADPTLGHAALAAFGPTVIENAKISAPLTYKEAGNLQGKYLNSGIEALISPKMSGDPVIDLVASPFTVLNADVGAVAKAWKEIGLVSRLDRGITGVSKIGALSSTLFVPATEVGWIAKASDTGIKEVLAGGKLADWKPLSAVQSISKDFEKAVDNPIASKQFINSIITKDPGIVKSTLAEKIALEPNTFTQVMEAGIQLSDDATAEAARTLWKDAQKTYIDTSLAFAKEIATSSKGDPTIAASKLFAAGEKLGRTPVENMANVALQQGTEHYTLITNALEDMKKLDIQNAIKIPTGSPIGASKAISGAELDLVNVMPEKIADKIIRYSGTNELRKINNIEDIAKLNIDEINYLAKEKGLTKADLEKYVENAKAILNPDVTSESAYKITTDFTKETSWSTPKSEAWRKDFSKFGIEQGEDGKWTWNPTKINEMSDKDFKFLVETNHANLVAPMREISPEMIVKANIADNRKAELIKDFSDVLKVEEIKRTLKPGKETPMDAARNALKDLQAGDIKKAAESLAESKAHNQVVLLAGKNADAYADTSVQKILRMVDEGAPETLVKQMAKERAEYALQTLAKKGNEEKRIAFKISQGDELTEAERLKLWNDEELRGLGKDAMWHDKDRNALIDGLKKDAIASGDKERINKLADEMKKEKENCIKKGECVGAGGSSRTVVAIAAGTAGTAAMLSNASGKTWTYDKETDTYYPMKLAAGPKEPLETVTSIEGMVTYGTFPSGIVNAWKALVNSGIDELQYSEGAIHGLQGVAADPTEMECQNFAIKAARLLNTNGYQTKVISLLGRFTDNGEVFGHSVLGIEDPTRKNLYVIDPSAGLTRDVTATPQQIYENLEKRYKDPMNWTPLMTGKMPVLLKTVNEMTYVDPQTTETFDSATDFVGKEIPWDNRSFVIENAVIVGGDITQKVEEGRISPASKSEDVISQELDGVRNVLGPNPWFSTGKESKVVK